MESHDITNLDQHAVMRTARKAHLCVCLHPEYRSGTPNGNYRPDCLGTIQPGDRYVEYMANAAGYESGDRYCWKCGTAVWIR